MQGTFAARLFGNETAAAPLNICSLIYNTRAVKGAAHRNINPIYLPRQKIQKDNHPGILHHFF